MENFISPFNLTHFLLILSLILKKKLYEIINRSFFFYKVSKKINGSLLKGINNKSLTAQKPNLFKSYTLKIFRKYGIIF